MTYCYFHVPQRSYPFLQVDVTYLQYQNQKLVQQLELQKHELHDLEDKIKELKDRQTSYDDMLITMNQLWSQVNIEKLVHACSFLKISIPIRFFIFFVLQLVDDLILLGVRAGGGQNAIQTLDHADHSRGYFKYLSCSCKHFFFGPIHKMLKMNLGSFISYEIN